MTKKAEPPHQQLLALVERLARQPKSTDNLLSTWCPPDWEQVVDWWDNAVDDARKLTGITHSPAAAQDRPLT